jgi:hypothetical protein
VRRPTGQWLFLAVLMTLLSGLVGGVVGGMAVRLTADEDAAEVSDAPTAVARGVALREESAITDVVRGAQEAVVTVINEVEPRRRLRRRAC